jgi:hypothetical protein
MLQTKRAIKDLALIILLAISFSGFTIQSFVLKTNIILQVLATFLAGFFFAVALKNVKFGLFYALIAIILGALITWVAIILPPLTYGEDFMISYTTEVFTYFVARLTLLSFPGIIFGVLIGSIVSDGI